MIVYHGLTEIIKNSDVIHSKNIWILVEVFTSQLLRTRQRNGQFERA